MVAHNVHEAEGIGHIQEGRTSLLMFSQMTEYLDMPGSEKDVTGLGRWTTMLLKGDGVQTWIVCGYNSCMNKKTDSSTSYQQQRHFLIMHKQDHMTCPCTKFREDLLHLLNTWREEGYCIIVCLDANKDIYKKGGRKNAHRRGRITDEESGGCIHQ